MKSLHPPIPRNRAAPPLGGGRGVSARAGAARQGGLRNTPSQKPRKETHTMNILHFAFDGLDIAYKATIPLDLVKRLETAKAEAEAAKESTVVTLGDTRFEVSQSGGSGGYAFVLDAGPRRGIWTIKKPNAKDPWGLAYSSRSRPLAIKGIDFVRNDIDIMLKALGCVVPSDGTSIRRVDYAIDFHDPAFVLDPFDFVTHSQTKNSTYLELSDTRINGRSGRVSSATFGKMPGRQVIVYDKREEAMTKNKLEWFFVWDAAMERAGRAPLDFNDAAKSRVWRAEFRLAKRALRDRAGIKGWDSLYAALAAEFQQLTHDIELRVPSSNDDRTDWTVHPNWEVIRDVLSNNLFEHETEIDELELTAEDLRHKQNEFLKLTAGHALTFAALEGVETHDIDAFLEDLPWRMQACIEQSPRSVADRLRDAKRKYRALMHA